MCKCVLMCIVLVRVTNWSCELVVLMCWRMSMYRIPLCITNHRYHCLTLLILTSWRHQYMINGVSGTPIQMNGEKGENFLTQAPKAQNRRLVFSPPIPFPPIQANVKLRLWKIETYWLKHFFSFIFSFHSKSEPTNICPCSTLGNNLIFS